jgi:amidase
MGMSQANKVRAGLALAVAAAASSAAQAHGGFDVTETTIAATQQAIRQHTVTCRQVIDAYLERIRVYDQPTRLNAFVLINAKAQAEADRTDADFKRTHQLPPLGCIAIVVKDNYDTKDLQTTGGSLAMKGFVPTTDAFMVQKIRAAGAIIIGKSNMAEWAFSPYLTHSSIAGITRNPYDLEYVPAGSSGGTAAAVAANLGEIGLGTDTGNSIRGPSSHNALVGIRPTIGLTSRDGIIPLALAADMGGPMARTVADAATLLDVLAGYDAEDPVTQVSQGHIPKTYTASLDKNGLHGARIGVYRAYIDTTTADPEVKAVMEKAILDLKAQGAEILDPFVIPGYADLIDDAYCGDFQSDVNAYLAKYGQGAPYHTIADVVTSGLYSPYIEQRLKDATAAKAATDTNSRPCPDTYHDEKKVAFREAILAEMDKHHLDAIVYPTWINAPRKVGDGRGPAGDNSQVLSPYTGFPAITVPMGYTHGTLPAGITFLGKTFAEPDLIKYAYAYEQASKHRHPPAKFTTLN